MSEGEQEDLTAEGRAAFRETRATWDSMPLAQRRQSLSQLSPLNALQMYSFDHELFDANTMLQCITRILREVPVGDRAVCVLQREPLLLFSKFEHWATAGQGVQRALLELVDGHQALLSEDGRLWLMLYRVVRDIRQLPKRPWEVDWTLRSIGYVKDSSTRDKLFSLWWANFGWQLEHVEVKDTYQILQRCSQHAPDRHFLACAALSLAQASERASMEVIHSCSASCMPVH